MISIPSEDKKFFQDNSSDIKGNISVTKNVTFDTEGYLELSKSFRSAIDSSMDDDLDEAAVIIRSGDHGYWAFTHDQPFEIDESKILSVRPTQDVTAGTPSGDIQSDATFSNGLLIATQETDVDYYDPVANTWTDTNLTLANTSGSQHPIEKFLSLNSFAIANVNTVAIYPNPITATPSASATLTIPADFYVTSLAYFNQNLYIGTMNRFGGHAFMYVWNGFGSAAQSAFEVDSNIIFDLCVHKDSIVLVTGKGQLLRFNGAGFMTLDNFPVFYTDIVISDETNVNMYHNCLKSSGDLLYINLSTASNKLRLTNQPDGTWCYDSALGFLYHRFSPSIATVNTETIALGSYNTTSNEITVVSAPVTGTQVIHDAVSAATTPATPLIDGKTYYTIKVDSTHVKLATTKANALAGTAIDITAQPSGDTRLVFCPNIDFGQYLACARAVAILPIERDVAHPQYGTEILWGGELYGRDRNSLDYIGVATPAVENRGYFVTPKIYSSNITDKFNLVTLRFSEFLSDIDKIVIKYRTSDDRLESIRANGSLWLATWTSTTTFTSTEVNLANAVVGDEVEFLDGGGAGICAHITAISVNAGTYTVTIDETYDNYTSGDAARFVFRNWKKWQTISYGDVHAERGFLSAQLGAVGKFIQFKIEMRGIGVRIESFDVDNVYHLPKRK